MKYAYSLSIAAVALAVALPGCITSDDTTDEVYAATQDDKGSKVEDDELYWYQRGADTTKSVWGKYRFRPDSALLKASDTD